MSLKPTGNQPIPPKTNLPQSPPLQAEKQTSPSTEIAKGIIGAPKGGELDRNSIESARQEVNHYLDQLEESGLFSGFVSVAVGDIEISRSIQTTQDQSPFEANTLFNSCSVSKMLTAIAIYQLVQGGKIKLDETLDKYLTPEDVKEVYDSHEENSSLTSSMQKIKVKQLLNHTAGVTGEGAPHIFEPEQIGHHHYSNLGFNLLAKIIAKHSDHRSFQSHIQKEIFAKATMKDAGGYAEKPNIDSLPKQMTQLPSGETKLIDRQSSTPMDDERGRGNGCWEMSTEDWMNFSKAIRHGPFSSYFEQMQTNLVPAENGLYASGLEVHPVDHGRILGHDGNSPGASAGFYLLEQKGKPPMTIVALSNFGQGRGGQAALEIAQALAGKKISVPLQQAGKLHACYQKFSKQENLEGLEEQLGDLMAMPNMKPDYIMEMASEAIRDKNFQFGNAVIQYLSSSTPERVVEWQHRFGLALLEYGKDDLFYLKEAHKNLEAAKNDQNVKDDIEFIKASEEALLKVKEAINHLTKV